jgi:hypothetical protein
MDPLLIGGAVLGLPIHFVVQMALLRMAAGTRQGHDQLDWVPAAMVTFVGTVLSLAFLAMAVAVFGSNSGALWLVTPAVVVAYGIPLMGLAQLDPSDAMVAGAIVSALTALTYGGVYYAWAWVNIASA